MEDFYFVDIQRVIDGIIKSEEGCWVYNNKHGKPSRVTSIRRVTKKGNLEWQTVALHRLLHWYYKGSVPGQLVQLCKHEYCINPDHFVSRQSIGRGVLISCPQCDHEFHFTSL